MEKSQDLTFIVMAMTAQGKGISGCDRIAIEFCKRWSREYPVTIVLWEEGFAMYQRHHVQGGNIRFKTINMKFWKNLGFFVNYIATILSACVFALHAKIKNDSSTIVYSASEFWMDSLPGIILKLRFPKIIWMATWFQTAPNPLLGFKEGERVLTYRLHALVYWLVQLPIKPLIKKWADFVLVNNEEERKQFPNLEKGKKVIVVLGAVNLKEIASWKSKFGNLPKAYDGVFQGRFHPQKGVVELIDIWKLVVKERPGAKLILIGDGPLMQSVKLKVQSAKLEKNIKLTGYLFDGEEKYRIFAQSKLVVHPSFYDSGGMASLEAMAFGLPAVGFNLASYKSYYPKGMVKVPLNNLSAFAKAIVNLLSDRKLYDKMGNEAKDLVSQNWSWDKRAKDVLGYIRKG